MLYSKGLSDNSVKAYISDLYNLFIENKVTDVNSANLNNLIDLISKKAYSPNTKKRKLSVIKQFVKWFNTNHQQKLIILEDIKIKSGQKLPETLSILEIDNMINYFKLDSFLSSRNRTIIDFMYSTGCRVSELCNVKISDLDFDDDYVQLTGKGSKQRIVPIGSKLKENLVLYLDTRNLKDPKNLSPLLFLSLIHISEPTRPY